MPAANRRSRGLELASAFLMGFAALATSWISTQASRWSGLQSSTTSESSRLRLLSNRADGEAAAVQVIDVLLFTGWIDAYAAGDSARTGFYRMRFRSEFKPAFDAWLASRPMLDPEAAPSPFSLPEYRPAKKLESLRLEDSAGIKSLEAQAQSGVRDRYLAVAVVLASSLFFSGMSRQFNRAGVQATMLAVAFLLCLGGLIDILGLPVLW